MHYNFAGYHRKHTEARYGPSPFLEPLPGSRSGAFGPSKKLSVFLSSSDVFWHRFSSMCTEGVLACEVKQVVLPLTSIALIWPTYFAGPGFKLASFDKTAVCKLRVYGLKAFSRLDYGSLLCTCPDSGIATPEYVSKQDSPGAWGKEDRVGKTFMRGGVQTCSHITNHKWLAQSMEVAESTRKPCKFTRWRLQVQPLRS